VVVISRDGKTVARRDRGVWHDNGTGKD